MNDFLDIMIINKRLRIKILNYKYIEINIGTDFWFQNYLIYLMNFYLFFNIDTYVLYVYMVLFIDSVKNLDNLIQDSIYIILLIAI